MNQPTERSERKVMDEKERRIYYQNIVYAVCNIIDAELGTKLVCGTVGEPSTEVQDKVAEIMSGEPEGYAEFIKKLKQSPLNPTEKHMLEIAGKIQRQLSQPNADLERTARSDGTLQDFVGGSDG